jgi:hypothetical protein
MKICQKVSGDPAPVAVQRWLGRYTSAASETSVDRPAHRGEAPTRAASATAAARHRRRLVPGLRHARQDRRQGRLVTAHLAVDYAGAARIGDWIESAVEVSAWASASRSPTATSSAGKAASCASAIFALADKKD